MRNTLEKQNQKIAQDAAEIDELHSKAKLTIEVKNRMSTYDEHEVMDTKVSARMKPPRRSLSLGEVDQDEVSSDSGNTSHGRGNYDATASCSSERRHPLCANRLQQQPLQRPLQQPPQQTQFQALPQQANYQPGPSPHIATQYGTRSY